jgi:hypothetical protein
MLNKGRLSFFGGWKQDRKRLNRPNAILTTTTLQNDKIEQIFVIYDITLVILQIFRLF